MTVLVGQRWGKSAILYTHGQTDPELREKRRRRKEPSSLAKFIKGGSEAM